MGAHPLDADPSAAGEAMNRHQIRRRLRHFYLCLSVSLIALVAFKLAAL